MSSRRPLKGNPRYAKRTRPFQRGGRLVYPAGFKAPRRIGYGSVARTRGAAVTGEMKYFDTELQLTVIPAVTTTWVAGTILDPGTTINLGSAAVATPLCLFAPTVGAALNQRIGRKVKMMKCRVNLVVSTSKQTAQVALDDPPKVRIMLVQDNQSNAGQMTSAQLMRDAGGPTTTISSMQNPDNFGRFKVLKDKSFSISNPNSQSLSATNASFEQEGIKRHFKMSYTFKVPVDVHFNATNGGTVADIVDHSLHIIAGCDFAAAQPTLSYYARVCFKE